MSQKFPVLALILLLLLITVGCEEEKQAPTLKPGTVKIKRLTKGKTTLNPDVRLDQTKVLAGKEQDLFLMVKFNVPEREKIQEHRPDLALSMVLDASGSMKHENKMKKTKEAAIYAIDQLKPSDKLALVKYNTSVSTLQHLTPVTSPNVSRSKIKRIPPGGGTDLCGGMDHGIELLKYDTVTTVKRVILLSDGLANSGITEAPIIAKRARRARQKGITISTLGVGSDYNEDLMQLIAEEGGGRYYFIENPTQIKDIFETEMQTLFQTVAQNVTLAIKPTPSLTSYNVLGKSDTVEKIASLYGGEHRTILFKLRVKPTKRGTLELGKVVLWYDNLQSGKSESVEFEMKIDVVTDSTEVAYSVVKEVRAEALLVETEMVHEASVKLYEQGKKQEALQQINAQNAVMKRSNTILQDKRIVSKIEALDMEKSEMDEADKSRQNRQIYLKKSKERSHYAKKGKRGKIMVSTASDKESIIRLQKALKDEGAYKGPIDGKYSAEMEKAVAEYQQSQSLVVDSVAGPQTLKKLGIY